MRIGLDVMGGDYAPLNTVSGAIDVYSKLSPGTELYLLGDQFRITEICSQKGFNPGNFTIVHCSQTIKMDDHPVKSYHKKQDSSIVVGFNMLRNGQIDALASAGNTGAVLTGSYQTLKPLPGIMRPCISVEMPLLNGKKMLILDVGFNVDSKPDVLYQFGVLGSIYARAMMGIERPKVALLNIGEEEEKGNMVTKEAYKLMSDSADFDFVGNMEANRLFDGDIADVLVTDGFSGNICLKQAEGMYNLLRKLNIKNDFLEGYNYEDYGGTPVLGVPAPVIIGHGASSPLAVANMITSTQRALERDLVGKFKEVLLRN
ncbi:MAG: phosphate acyltransferase PlsX [Bacteroidales bacterium]|nr:phosphate acyltransferase PlsX [Bacteroidales bacterium]